MSENFISYITLSLLFLLIFFLGDLLYLKLKVSAEHTRKLVHVLSGLLSCTFIYYFTNPLWVLAICASFLLLLYLSMRFNFLKGINAVKRKTYGSIMFPLAIFLSFLFHWKLLQETPMQLNELRSYDFLYLMPVLILTFSDVLAAVAGRRYPLKKFNNGAESKSIGGSLAFFISAFVITAILPGFSLSDPLQAFAIALATAIAEALSRKGLDNLFIPLTAMLLLYLFL